MNAQALPIHFSPTIPRHCIIIPQGNNQLIVPTSELVCLEGDGNYSYLYLSDGSRHLVSKTLKSYAAFLDSRTFVRIHKSSIINMNYLQAVYTDPDRFVQLKGGQTIPVSRRRARVVNDVLVSWCSKKKS
jgi:two-component system, LytTR family, response regulator